MVIGSKWDGIMTTHPFVPVLISLSTDRTAQKYEKCLSREITSELLIKMTVICKAVCNLLT